MSVELVERIFRLAKKYPTESIITGPVAEAIIRRAEEDLELIFPPSYRYFLKTFGHGGICGEFCGIYPADPNSANGVVGLTLSERSPQNLSAAMALPKHLAAVYPDYYDGSLACIDCSRTDENGENPVVEWYPGESVQGDSLTELAPDFGTFMYKTVMPVALAEGMSEE